MKCASANFFSRAHGGNLLTASCTNEEMGTRCAETDTIPVGKAPEA